MIGPLPPILLFLTTSSKFALCPAAAPMRRPNSLMVGMPW